MNHIYFAVYAGKVLHCQKKKQFENRIVTLIFIIESNQEIILNS